MELQPGKVAGTRLLSARLPAGWPPRDWGPSCVLIQGLKLETTGSGQKRRALRKGLAVGPHDDEGWEVGIQEEVSHRESAEVRMQDPTRALHRIASLWGTL